MEETISDQEILKLVKTLCIDLYDKYYMPIENEKYNNDPEVKRIEKILMNNGVMDQKGRFIESHPLYKTIYRKIAAK